MRLFLSTPKALTVAVTLATFSTSFSATPAFSQKYRRPAPTPDSRLQHAIDDIYRNPTLAEQELKKFSSPTAEAYLAFLYFSNKNKFPNQQHKINTLLRRALAKMPDIALPDINKTSVKCSSTKEMLKYLRWIQEADNSVEVSPPNRIFIENPEACAEAFAPYYYSSRERALPFNLSQAEDFESVPEVEKVLVDIQSINGVENQDTNGTMVYGSYRQQRLEHLKASLAPQLYFKDANSKNGKTAILELHDFLKHWSNKELYNHRTYAALVADTEKAIGPLASFYSKNFHLKARTARKYAEAALQQYTISFLGRFSHSQLEEEISAPIYKVFSVPAESLEVLKKRIGQRDMPPSELSEALRLQILNDGNLEIINWLVKLGAPLNSGIEPPLFTAVDRPDVVAALIKAGADVNEKNSVGKTPLIQAAQYNDLATIKELVAHGANVNQKMSESDETHRLSTESGDDRIYLYNIGGRTALMYAAGFADANTINYLLSKGADKEVKDSEGAKPVKFLAWNKAISSTDKARLSKELQ